MHKTEDLPALLDELEIPVIYARECLKKYLIQACQDICMTLTILHSARFLCVPLVTGAVQGGSEDGLCLWTLAKQAAMRKASCIHCCISEPLDF